MRNPVLKKAREECLKGVDRARRRGATAVRILFKNEENITASFENGRLKNTGTQEVRGISVEIIKNSRAGRSSGNYLADLPRLIDSAGSLAEKGSHSHFTRFPDFPGEYHPVKSFSESAAGLSREELIGQCRLFTEKLKSCDSDLFIEAGAARSETENLICTSGGVCHQSRHSRWSLSGSVQRTRGTDMLFAGDYRTWKTINEFYNMKEIADRTIEDLEAAEHTHPGLQGEVKVLLSPGIFNALLSSLFMGINGRNVVRGVSPLTDKLNTEIFHTGLSITDDPHLDFCPGSAEISLDGQPTAKMNLVEKGVLKTFLYNLDTAGMAGTEPTGHNHCSPYSITVTPGDLPAKDIIGRQDRALYIKNLIGFGQGNLMNGDFSCNVGLGYAIENGEIKGRIKNTMVAGNIYSIFKNPSVPSSDLQPGRRLPWILVEGINASTQD